MKKGFVDLIKLQPDLHQDRSRKPRAFGVAALLCLALLALLVTVQIAHNHVFESDAEHCTLCIALHSAAPVAVMAAAVVMVSFGVAAPLAEARPVVRYWNPKLFTRPPPVGC